MTSSSLVASRSVVVIGKESVGKTQFLASLTGRAADVANFRGSTVACEEYLWHDRIFVDTPGITRASDAMTSRLALARMASEETVLLVVQATHLDDDLADLLPLAVGKPAAIVVTYWDKVAAHPTAHAALEQLERETGLPIVALDARSPAAVHANDIEQVLESAAVVSAAPLMWRAGWRIEPRPGILEHRWLGPVIAILLLLTPAITAVSLANGFAGLADPWVRTALGSIVTRIQAWPDALSLAKAILAGDYGLLTMGPMLFVWAAPTVVLYAFFLAAYKASGLVDRINAALHPLVRHVGLAGRDVVRVVMGFGCNVPAVISTRACSSCSRGSCISAIAFGAACSYQLPATLAVFAAAGAPWLVAPFLVFLCVTTLVYVRLVSPAEARSALNRLMIERRSFLTWPRVPGMWRDARGTIEHFFLRALPIFMAISVVASLAAWAGILDIMARGLAPLMAVFGLPGEAAMPMTPLQVLAGVYLAGVVLPCLVTVWTIAREQSWRFATLLVVRQAVAASSFTLALVWGGRLMGW